MDQKSFEQFETLCNAVFGNLGTGNTLEAREMLESICLHPSFVEKAESLCLVGFSCRTVFDNSKNIYALHCAGTSLIKLMTDYWNNYDNDQKLRIRFVSSLVSRLGDFILQYLIKNGAELPPHITTTLCTLICRITSLSWMTDTRQRNILELMLQYTKSRDNCIIALTILEELVAQMVPKSTTIHPPLPPETSNTQQNKAAIQFRDSNLLNVALLALNMLRDTFQADDATVGSAQLRNDLYDKSLKLLNRCFSYDCRASKIEDGLESHPTLGIPSDWLNRFLSSENLNLLFSMWGCGGRMTGSYERAEAPITTEIVEAVLWMICCSRTDLFSSSLETDVFSTLLQHLLNVLNSGHGLDDSDTVHAFCQLLDRFKVGVVM